MVGVEKWEALPGEHIRVKCEHSKAHEIGHILEDKWFSPERFFHPEQEQNDAKR